MCPKSCLLVFFQAKIFEISLLRCESSPTGPYVLPEFPSPTQRRQIFIAHFLYLCRTVIPAKCHLPDSTVTGSLPETPIQQMSFFKVLRENEGPSGEIHSLKCSFFFSSSQPEGHSSLLFGIILRLVMVGGEKNACSPTVFICAFSPRGPKGGPAAGIWL